MQTIVDFTRGIEFHKRFVCACLLFAQPGKIGPYARIRAPRRSPRRLQLEGGRRGIDPALLACLSNSSIRRGSFPGAGRVPSLRQLLAQATWCQRISSRPLLCPNHIILCLGCNIATIILHATAYDESFTNIRSQSQIDAQNHYIELDLNFIICSSIHWYWNAPWSSHPCRTWYSPLYW